MTATMQEPREELLARVLDEIRDRGISPRLTLRQLASELGTSHRMLCYHFGSRDGLLAAVLQALRVEDQAHLLELAEGTGRRGALMSLWKFYTAPANRRRLATFFYVFGLAVQEDELVAYESFLSSLDNWSRLVADLGIEEGLDSDTARAEADLYVASIRGMFMVLVATGDQERADAAVELLMERLSKGRAGRRR